jgi:hypothetical protein
MDFIGVLLITESSVQLSGMKFGGRIAPPAYNYTIRFESGSYHPCIHIVLYPFEGTQTHACHGSLWPPTLSPDRTPRQKEIPRMQFPFLRTQ